MNKYYTIPTYEEDTKVLNDIRRSKIKCSRCGHSITIMKKDREICTWCYHWVYKTEKAKFKYELKEIMNRRKHDIKNNTNRQTN